MPATPLPHSPAADRNKQPILEVLGTLLGESGTALEIASGTGQHVEWFAAALPAWTWQPTDMDREILPAIAARIADSGLRNVRAPLLLDVMAPQWPSTEAPFRETFDAIYCANMLHIAPWTACAGLMQGAARHLSPEGMLVTYGPYFEEGVPPSPGNTAFDASLRARDPSWGVRRLEDVAEVARRSGLVLRERHGMPAGNLLVVFSRE